MTGFWTPYADLDEARSKLCRLADAAAGPACGVSFSDGHSICVLRQAGGGTRTLWLNVLAQHAAAPPPPPPSPRNTGAMGKLKAWFWRAMELEAQAEMQNAQAQLAADQAMAQEFRDHVWEPAHEFLLRHKFIADTAGIALDAVGVAAAVVFFVAAPELGVAALAGSASAGLGLLTGASASIAAVTLAGIDTTIYVTEYSGHEAVAKRLDDSPTISWIRIGATIMLLPDLPVGGLRALKEVGEVSEAASQASEQLAAARKSMTNATRDLRNVTNPSRHPAEVARQMAKVRKYAAETQAQTMALDAVNSRLNLLRQRDLRLFPGSTVAGTALMSANPPGGILSEQQRQRDEKLQESLLMPANGMPHGSRMDIRIIGYSRKIGA